MFWDKDTETLDRNSLHNLQLQLLRKSVEQAGKSPCYGKMFRSEGISPEKIKSLDDIRRIPFITKDTLRENYPYGFLAVPKEKIVRMHSSSGTTGRATVIFHTAQDINEWAGLVARCMYMAGVREHDIFQNMMGYGLFTGGLGFHYGAEKLGAMVIPSGAGNSRRQIMLMQEFDTTVIHIIPSYALHLIETFREVGVDPRKDLKLKIAFIGAEPHTEETRLRIEAAYGVKAYNSYGLSEMNGPGVAFECQQQSGLHVWEDSYIVEVVDPKTLEPVQDGQEGEAVFTSLKREGMPLLRYRTRDIVYRYPDPCPCGRTHRRISRIKGRTDDMLIVKGVNMFPIQIEKTLMAIPELGTNFLILLDTVDDNDFMTVRVEVSAEMFRGDMKGLEKLRKMMADELRSELLVTPRVELVEPDTLPKTEGKAVRVIDNRKQWG